MKIPSVKRSILLLVIFISGYTCHSQEIINIVYVGDKGITQDIRKANTYIVIKGYPKGIFERLDYGLSAPLTSLRTYNDSNLTNLDGRFLKYYGTGALQTMGQYSNNKKNGEWFSFNDTGKIVLKETYDQDKLLRSQNPDTAKKQDIVKFDDDREAEYISGRGGWNQYILKALKNLPEGETNLKGSILAMFKIDTSGQVTDVYLKKSSQFTLDEEVIKILRFSPRWKPALQNGHTVNAYRMQPITFFGLDE